MDLEKINKKHFRENDMYYRVGFGLSSKILDYKNGILKIQVNIGKRWRKSYNATAHELAHCWKKAHPELSEALGCKVYIIDSRKNRYKQQLLNSGVDPGYDAKKGLLFQDNYLN